MERLPLDILAAGADVATDFSGWYFPVESIGLDCDDRQICHSRAPAR